MNPKKPEKINEKDIERMAREVGKPLPPGFLDKVMEKAKAFDKAKAPKKSKSPEKEIGED